MAAQQARQAANILSLISLGEQINQENAEMALREVAERDDDNEVSRDSMGGPLWQQLDENDNWQTLTNFQRHQILSIFEALQSSLPSRRGRKPTLPDLDALVSFLIWAKMGIGLKNLAALLNIKKGKLAAAIERIRLPLYTSLFKRWWENRLRPTPLPNTAYPYIALLIDSTTTETCRPGGPFEEVKAYFDVKNGIYGIKKEVAVSAHPPHYALFVSTFHLGSEHDFSIHKSEHGPYVTYLTKTPRERGLLPADQQANFAILGDSAYIGDPSETPGLRRIALQKHSLVLPHQRPAMQELKRLRVPVECWFGRYVPFPLPPHL